MEANQVLVLLSVVILGIAFCVLVVFSVTRKSKTWPTLAYGVGLLPALAHANFHGFGYETLLAACFFVALTWVILYFAKKEIGDGN
jgi:hypothetical protein